MSDIANTFSTHAEFYKKLTQITGDVAEYALRSIQPPITTESVIHDNACGPGVVSFLIIDKFAKSLGAVPRIYGTDLAPGMIQTMETEIEKRPELQGKVTASLLDMSDLKDFEDGKFTHSITNFGIIGLDDDNAIKAAKEIHRTLKPNNGVALVTTWQQSAVELISVVCQRIRPGKPVANIITPEWSTKEKLFETLVAGGFEEGKINVHLKEAAMNFDSEEVRLQYFCHPFWGMWRKGWSDEEAAQWNEVMAEEIVKFMGKGSAFTCRAWVGVAKV